MINKSQHHGHLAISKYGIKMDIIRNGRIIYFEQLHHDTQERRSTCTIASANSEILCTAV